MQALCNQLQRAARSEADPARVKTSTTALQALSEVKYAAVQTQPKAMASTTATQTEAMHDRRSAQVQTARPK